MQTKQTIPQTFIAFIIDTLILSLNKLNIQFP